MMKFSSILLVSGLLAGCTGLNVFKDSTSSEGASRSANVTSDDDLAPETMEKPKPAGLKAAEIRKALSGKSWRWKGPKASGVTLYADDGSSLVEITGKGTTTGKWEARDGQLCESFAPAPFLPNGMDMLCQPMTGSGNKFKVGQASFTLA